MSKFILDATNRQRAFFCVIFSVPFRLALVAGFAAILISNTPALADGRDDALAGVSATQSGDLDEAIRLYTSAIRSRDLSNEDRAFVFFERGGVFLTLGLHANSIKDYTEGLIFGEGDAIIFNNLGVAYAALGDHAQAVDQFDRALSFDPDFPTAVENRAASRRALVALAGTGIGGIWAHTQTSARIFTFTGEMVLPNAVIGQVRADYQIGSSTGSEPGRLIGRLDGQVFSGTWITETFGTPCETDVEGRNTWGKFEFVFNDDFTGFDGTFGICKGALGRTWTGIRTGPAE